jgi:hypothetical protein
MRGWLTQVIAPGLLLAAFAASAQGPQPGPAPRDRPGAAPAAGDGDARLQAAQKIVLRMLGGATTLDQLDDAQRADLLRALDEIQTALPKDTETRTSQRRRYGYTSSAALECATPASAVVGEGLSDAQRLDLSTALDEIQTALLTSGDNRVTCHYERKTGTNLVSLHCETLAQREQNARESQEFMRERAATPQVIR